MLPASTAPLPEFVAILRGLTADRALDVGQVLYEAGIRTIEVPLNSPDPWSSISQLVAGLPPDCVIGAGTVLSVADVERTQQEGGRIVVAPNIDPAVVGAALRRGLRILPGIATATEAFAAVAAGATELKLFPATTDGPEHLRALRAVLPATVRVFPVGGVGADDLAPWLEAGAAGFGFGSELFKPAYALAEIGRRAWTLRAKLEEAARVSRE